MRKNNLSDRRRSANSADNLEQLLYAVAFVILRRQMRGRWTSPLRAATSALA